MYNLHKAHLNNYQVKLQDFKARLVDAGRMLLCDGLIWMDLFKMP